MFTADTMFADVHDDGQRLRLEQQMLSLLTRGMVEVMMTSAIIGPLWVVWLTLPHIGLERAVGPALALMAVSAERAWLLRRAKREHADQDTNPRRWANALAWRGWLSGAVIAVWCGFVVASGNENLIAQVVALIAILGAGGVVQFCSWPPVMWAAMSPIVLGMALALAAFGTGDRWSGVWFLVGLWLVLGLAGARFARTLHNDMQTRLRNEQLLRELHEKHEQAQNAIAAKSRFFSAASHDLRQPLQAMSLYISVLDGKSEDAATVARLGECMSALDRLLTAVLDLTRLDSGQMTAQPRAFALQPLLERMADMYQGTARQKGLSLRVHPTSAWTHSDPVLLERIVANLLTNALRYTRVGGVLLAVRQRTVGGVALLQLWVLDTGIGIAPHAHESIFEEFVQLGNPERNPDVGYGLGLPTVRRMAALLGHTIFLRSTEGRGSLFGLELENHAPLPQSLDAAPSAVIATSRSPLHGRVLVVEDHAAVRDALLSLLTGWGLTVHAAADGEHALAAMQQARFDVVLSDWRLPGAIDGLAVLRATRESQPTLKLALLITGEDSPSLAQAQTEFPVLRKPLRLLRLRSVLTQHLQATGSAKPP